MIFSQAQKGMISPSGTMFISSAPHGADTADGVDKQPQLVLGEELDNKKRAVQQWAVLFICRIRAICSSRLIVFA